MLSHSATLLFIKLNTNKCISKKKLKKIFMVHKKKKLLFFFDCKIIVFCLLSLYFLLLGFFFRYKIWFIFIVICCSNCQTCQLVKTESSVYKNVVISFCRHFHIKYVVIVVVAADAAVLPYCLHVRNSLFL